MADAGGNRFSSLLLEGLDFYRRGRMLDAVRSWEEAYLLEPTNLRAREFLRSALERIHARMSSQQGASAQPGVAFSDMQQFAPRVPLEQLSGPGLAFRSFDHHPWLRAPESAAGVPAARSSQPGQPSAAPAVPASSATIAAPVIAAENAREQGEQDEPDDAPVPVEEKLPPPAPMPMPVAPSPPRAPISGVYSFKPTRTPKPERAADSLPAAPRADERALGSSAAQLFAPIPPAPSRLTPSRQAAVARAEMARIEAAKSEAARIEAAKIEAEKAEAARIEAERIEAEKIEAAKVSAARAAETEKTLQTDALSLDLLRTDEHAHAQMLAGQDPLRSMPTPSGNSRKSSPSKLKQGSPWDDGPSIALPQSDPPPEKQPAVWQIHGAPAAQAPITPDETTIWMTAAGELMALDDFTGALELVNKVLIRHPDHAAALATRDTCEHNLIQMYESRLGGVARRPKVVLGPDEVIWLNLDPRAGFVLAQIDGEVSFEDLYAICGLTRLDTARILSQLLSEGVIAAEGEPNQIF